MSKQSNNKKYITSRYMLVLALIFLTLIAPIIVYAVKNTVLHAEDWNAKADSILTNEMPLEPERGKLLADNGTVLAANLKFYVARLDCGMESLKEDTIAKYLPALCDSLAVLDDSKSAAEWKITLDSAYHHITKNGKHLRSFRLCRRMLSHKERQRLLTFPLFNKKKKYSGLYFEDMDKRCKPYGAMASRSIGNVSEDEQSSSVHGRSGLEMALDSLLYGKPGVSTKIQLTFDMVTAEKVPAVKGYDITTTINVALQDIVENELYSMCHESEARWGTAVLMEVATGEIKAISNLEWNEQAGDYVEGRNNAVLGYEPGSVMKPISMMMALEDGLVSDINAPIPTGSTWTFAGRAVTDPHGGTALTPRQIIAMSSNIGMSKIITGNAGIAGAKDPKRYSSNPGKFRDRLEEMGFFEPFNSGIGGEQQPFVPRLGNTNADRVALTRMAFGYSTLIPPLCTLAMYNAIANDGKYVRPHLVKKLSREGEPDSIVPVSYIRQRVCSTENALKLRQMLHDVVWSDRGTARKWLQDDNVEIAGKTGTAYTNSGGQYTNQRRFAFCGFFPYANPKYSCIVLMLGANRGAAASSGMVLKNVALKMYARGLLGPAPNYKLSTNAEGKVVTPKPTKLRLIESKNVVSSVIKQHFGVDSVNIMKVRRVKTTGGVPDVRGLSVRDAIARLEKLGLSVRFNGMGRVTSQSIAPGAHYANGQCINLNLTM